MASITISDVWKTFGRTTVLRGINLKIADGEFFTLLGPSGCGKTTLLRTIAGFIEPDQGDIRFDAEVVTHRPVHRRDIGMVFQDYALFPDKTIADNVAYGLRARRVGEHEVARRVADYLDRVSLGDLAARYPAELSGGQRQRAALARALAIRPKVLLMDEPLSNLDAKLRIAMRRTILELQRDARITTIFVTHDQDEALSMSDRIALLQDGSVAQVGTARDLYENPGSADVADFIGAANVLPVRVERRGDAGGLIVAFRGHSLHCADGGAKPGGDARLIVRPETLTLTVETPADAKAIAGRIVGCQYLGATTAYTVEIGAEGMLTIMQRTADGEPLHEGQCVHVVIPPSARAVAA